VGWEGLALAGVLEQSWLVFKILDDWERMKFRTSNGSSLRKASRSFASHFNPSKISSGIGLWVGSWKTSLSLLRAVRKYLKKLNSYQYPIFALIKINILSQETLKEQNILRHFTFFVRFIVEEYDWKDPTFCFCLWWIQLKNFLLELLFSKIRSNKIQFQHKN